MAIYSEITITFTNDWISDDELFIRIGNTSSSSLLRWLWNINRNLNFEVVEATPTLNAGEATATNFKTAFDLDFPSGFISSKPSVNSVLLQSETENFNFLDAIAGTGNTGTFTFTKQDFIIDGSGGIIDDPVLPAYPSLEGYTEKYFISYCDNFNVNRRVSILKKGYDVVQNLINSDLNNVGWVKNQLELTGNRLVATNTATPHWATYTISKDALSKTYTLKFQTKASEYSRVYIRCSSSGSDYFIVYYDINSNIFYNEIESNFTINSKTATSVGSGFYEVVIQFTTDDAIEMDVVLGIVNDSNQFIFVGDNLDGVNLSGLEIKTINLTDGESAKELLADVDPITISYESADDFKFSPIRPSVAEVFMIFGGSDGIDFEEFWTADEREYKILDIKDGTIEWSGYVIPGGFEYELKGGLYYASLKASDGLATLDAVTFVDDKQKPYGNQDLVYNNGFEFPFSLIITEILKKLQLDLDLWTCVDSYEQSMLKTGDVREADPLSASFVNVKTYIKSNENEKIPYWYGSGEEWNCKEVLENILYIFGAKLYQELGVWRLKTINSDIDYGSEDTQRYWRKYNTAGTYLTGYEAINDQINITCNDSTKDLIGNDHIMSMDDVYKAFRMNYEYTFIRDGDSPLNLLPNGNFCDFVNDSILAAPTGWLRWRRDNKWYIRIKDITIPFEDAGGHTCGIEIGTHKSGIPISQGVIRTDPNPAIWTSLKVKDLVYVGKGDKISLDIWNKYSPVSPNGEVSYYPVYRLMLWTDTKVYFLRNSIVDNARSFTWEEAEIKEFRVPFSNFLEKQIVDVFFYLNYFDSSNGTSSDTKTYNWWEFNHVIENTPESGHLEFHIHGLAASRGRISPNFPAFLSYKDGIKKSNWLRVVRENWADQGGDIPRLQITGVILGIIPNENNLPEKQDYVYNNENQNYTLQVDPITIYNGDVQDANHISNIIVPTNTSGGKNFWDDLSNTYNSSSLGLLTVREIMRQYQKPYRVFEGTVKLQDARFGTVYTFSTIPDVKFIIQRATFNKQKQYIQDATFVQLTSDVLPDGGFEGNNDLEPFWIETGNSYCELSNGLNTGFVIIEEQDVNPNSETYQETREVVSETQNLTSCPLFQPRLYYWGSDNQFLNTYTLLFSPFTQVDNKEIQISYNNQDGNYLYFVHLKTLGVVDKITTLTSPNNVLSDWVYLNDIIINGYLYRVLRTDYVMSEFVNFTHNFKFA